MASRFGETATFAEYDRLLAAAHTDGTVETVMRLRALQELAANLTTENLLLMAASTTGAANLAKVAANLRRAAEG